jgi:hypothetical protein
MEDQKSRDSTHHNRLVIATHLMAILSGIHISQEGSENTAQRGPAEFVVKPHRTNWGFKHDIQTTGVMCWFANILLPGPLVIRNQEI